MTAKMRPHVVEQIRAIEAAAWVAVGSTLSGDAKEAVFEALRPLFKSFCATRAEVIAACTDAEGCWGGSPVIGDLPVF